MTYRKLLGLGVFFMVFVFVSLYLLLNKIIPYIVFRPEKIEIKETLSFHHPHKDIWLSTDDSIKIHAIHFKAPHPKGAILYFHGNKGNLKRWGSIAAELLKYQYDVFVIDYQGYGKSDGFPSEKGLYSDAYALLKYVDALDYSKTIYFGRSLGSGVAAWLSAQKTPDKIILETPFHHLGKIISSYIPFSKIEDIDIQFPSETYLQNIEVPILILHGTDDEVIPIGSADSLYHAISSPFVKFVTIENGKHNNLSEFDDYWVALDDFINNN